MRKACRASELIGIDVCPSPSPPHTFAPNHLAAHASHAHSTQTSLVSTFPPPTSCARFSPHIRLTGWKGSQAEALSRRATTGCCIGAMDRQKMGMLVRGVELILHGMTAGEHAHRHRAESSTQIQSAGRERRGDELIMHGGGGRDWEGQCPCTKTQGRDSQVQRSR